MGKAESRQAAKTGAAEVEGEQRSLLDSVLKNVSDSLKYTLRNTRYILLVASEKLKGNPDRTTESYNQDVFLNWVIIIIILAGLFSQLLKNPSVPFFFVLAVFASLLQSMPKASEDMVVISRYSVSLIPFVYYYFTAGIFFILSYKHIKLSFDAVKLIAFSILFCLPFVNLNNVTTQIYIAKNPYSPGYRVYLDVAEWAKRNLPPDSIVASRKNRIFYMHSGLKGICYWEHKYGATRYDQWTKQLEEATLRMYLEQGVDYLVLDSFSGDAYNKILPIISNNQQFFEIYYVPAQFNLKEGFVKTIPELVNFINYVYSNQRQIFVPTVVLKVNSEKLKNKFK